MKKARIILSAIAIVAVVCGASAFKAKNAYSSVIYTGSLATSCPTKTFATTVISGESQVYYTTSSAGTNCSLAFTVADSK